LMYCRDNASWKIEPKIASSIFCIWNAQSYTSIDLAVWRQKIITDAYVVVSFLAFLYFFQSQLMFFPAKMAHQIYFWYNLCSKVSGLQVIFRWINIGEPKPK
jgi:hypothetical protein